MFPIDKFTFTKKKRKDGCLFIHGGFRRDDITILMPMDQAIKGLEERAEDKLRERVWRETYGDLIGPLNELMCLARYAAETNPSAYPEAARIKELGDQLFGLLDWRKQLAEKQSEQSEQKNETK
jgi:hypothetical protein